MNKLTNEQKELLVHLMEEASEVVKACSKYLCHGDLVYDGTIPVYNNWFDLQTEVGDFLAVLEILSNQGIVKEEFVMNAMDRKSEELPKYLHGELLG